MDGLGQVAGSGVEVEFEGKTYIFEPLTLGDFGTIENHMRSKLPNVIKLAVEACDGLDAETRKEVMSQAYKEAKEMHSIEPDKVLEWIVGTLDGLSYILFLKLDQRYPGEFTIARIHKLLLHLAAMDKDQLTEFKRKIYMVSGLNTEGN